tara:strand:+ start:1446 stop:1637 length:192 start_codon:yes stop_codon:yes gene_type:complete
LVKVGQTHGKSLLDGGSLTTELAFNSGRLLVPAESCALAETGQPAAANGNNNTSPDYRRRIWT